MQFLGWMLGAQKTHDIDLLEQNDDHGEFRPRGYFLSFFKFFFFLAAKRIG